MRYCFDIDGTICTTDCHYEDAKPYKNVIKKINSLYNSGNSIILYTSRGSGSGIDWSEFTKKQVDDWGVKRVNRDELFWDMLKAIQELSAKVTALEAG